MRLQLNFIFVVALCGLFINVCARPDLTAGPIPEARKLFNGYSVIRAKLATEAQFKVLLQIQETDPTLDFWSGPTPEGADIMVSPKQRLSVDRQLAEHGVTSKTLIADVEKLISHQRQREQEKLKTASAAGIKAPFWESYQRMDDIFNWLDSLQFEYPNLVSIQTIGNSTEGRPLRLLKLSTGGNAQKPTIFIDGTFHAREFISPATVTFMLNELLVNATQHQDILQNLDIYWLVISNPDGYEYAHTVNRMWRKTRSENAGSTCIGTDLNRNFDHEWGGIGTSPNPCSDTYHGASPCSEPECKAISDFILNTKVNWWAYLTFHSASQMWLTPWGYTDDEVFDHGDMINMGLSATNALTKLYGTKYKVGPSGSTIYYTSGTSADWARGIADIKYSLTVELRDTGEFGHLLPPEQIIPSGEETFEALKVLTREVVRQQECAQMSEILLTPAYTPLGDIANVAGMETYETGDKSLKTLLIVVYDIYGFSPSPNIYQISDKFAESGVRVAMPDFFRGEPWRREHYPYPTDQEFYEFVKATSWEESVRADMIEVIKHYKSEGITKFGIFGFCFGGKIAALATGEFHEDIRVAAHFHPATMNMSDAALIRSPTILLPGANDPDMTEYCQVINDNNGLGSCEYTHFRDVNHGYAGGRADWDNLVIRRRAQEAVTLARNFFCEKLKNP